MIRKLTVEDVTFKIMISHATVSKPTSENMDD